jgi:seryl-tRNA synthetase
MLKNFKPQFFYDADKGVTGSPAAEPITTVTEPMIPKSRFDEINQRAKDAEAKLQALETERKTENEKRLEEQQKWKELAEERAAKLTEAERKAAKADEYETEMKSYVEETIAKIPDDMKSLLPDGSVENQFKWLKRNFEKLIKPVAPSTAAGMRGAGGEGGESAPQELRQLGSAFGLTKEQQERAAKRYAEKANK